MGLNWEAFAQQVAGGIQRGASGWAGTIRSDIERKKDMADWKSRAQIEEGYKNAREVRDREWQNQSQLFGAGLAKMHAKYTSDLQLQAEKDKSIFDQSLKSQLGDPNLRASWAWKHIAGKGQEANEEYDLLNFIQSGGEYDPKKHKAVIDRLPPIVRGNLNSIIQDNAEKAMDRRYKMAHLEYMRALRDQIEDKTPPTLPKLQTMKATLQTQLEASMDGLDALSKDMGYQASMQALGKYKGDAELFKAKDPAGYAKYADYMGRQAYRMDILGNLRQVGTWIDGEIAKEMKVGPIPEQPEPEAPNAEGGKKPEAKKNVLPGAVSEFGMGSIPGAGLVRGIGDAVASMLPTPSYAELAQEYGMTIDQAKESIYIVQNPADLRAVKEGMASVPPGTYIYDPVKRALLIKIGNDRFMEVGAEMSRAAEKKIPRKDRNIVDKSAAAGLAFK